MTMTMMTMQNNHISEVWRELENTTSIGTSKRLYSEHLTFPVYGIYQNPERRYGIAFSFSRSIQVDVSSFYKLSSLDVRIVKDASFTDKDLLIIQITDSTYKDIFSSLCENLILTISSVIIEKTFVKTILNQLELWKTLFENKRSDGLSLTEQNGLWGELHLLEKLLTTPNINKSNAVMSWVGPEKSVRDFQYNSHAIEVKTSSCNNSNVVTINGARQLDETHLDSLHLFHCIIESSKGNTYTLNDKVDRIEKILSDDSILLSVFRGKLFEVGYVNTQRHLYADRHIELRNEDCYMVKDSFPRIKENEVRASITNVKYEVNLAACANYLVNEYKLINSLAL